MARRRVGQQRIAPQWTRQKMLALLIGVAAAALVLIAGLVLSVVYAVQPRHGDSPDAGGNPTNGAAAAPSASATDAASAAIARDALAAKPMEKVGDDASHPGQVSMADPGPPILLPRATAAGPAGVPTGFPQTPEGAMAQLAAIDQVAFQSGSLAGARQVVAAWAMPGGPTGTSWTLVKAMAVLLSSAGVSGGGSHQLALVLTPLMGQIKGAVGPDFVVPCVDFELDVTLEQTVRGATADCQRMVWNPDAAGGGRWMIGPGSEPATPPSVWPDTDIAIQVGYRDLRQEPK